MPVWNWLTLFSSKRDARLFEFGTPSLLPLPFPPLAPAHSAWCYPSENGDRYCDGLGTDDETTLTLFIFIHQPLPSTVPISVLGTTGTLPCMNRSLALCWSRCLCAPSLSPRFESVAAVSSVACCPPCCWGFQSGVVVQRGGEGRRGKGGARGGWNDVTIFRQNSAIYGAPQPNVQNDVTKDRL